MPLAKAAPRRKTLSMTSLIDVIFLLLLFFMLSSTFSRFGEIELLTGGQGVPQSESKDQMLFLRLADTGLTLDGVAIEAKALPERVAALGDGPFHLVLSVAEGAKAQALADVMLPLRGLPHTRLTVLR